MKSASLVLVLTACLSTGLTFHAFAQPQLSDTVVQEALSAGQDKKALKKLVATCTARPGFGEAFSAQLVGGLQDTGVYDVTFTDSRGRIAFLGAEAKRLYETISLEDVPDEYRRPGVFVFIEPQGARRSSSTVAVASPIETVILRSKKTKEAIVKPVTMETDPIVWKNLLGGQVENNRAEATFTPDDIRALPPGDIEVVIVAVGGERRCSVNKKERAKFDTPDGKR